MEKSRQEFRRLFVLFFFLCLAFSCAVGGKKRGEVAEIGTNFPYCEMHPFQFTREEKLEISSNLL